MPKTPFRIVVLASTNGTDLQAIIDEMKAGKMPGIELAGVVSNKRDCYAIQRAREQGYETKVVSEADLHAPVDPKTGKRPRRSRVDFDAQLIESIDLLNPDLIVLVGYMRILTPLFINHYTTKGTQIINVHPALIPKFSGPSFFGKSVHEAVIAAHETESGMTIHRVTNEVDAGEILLQKRVPVTSDDTPDTLKLKVQALEKEYYPEIIRQLAVQK